MKIHFIASSLLLLLSTLLTACDREARETIMPGPGTSVREAIVEALQVRAVQAGELTINDTIELEWNDLIPEDWQPDKLMDQYDADGLSDDDPRAAELMEKLEALWKESPVVHDYDGKIVKLPGFVVPLEMDARAIHEFLLVPYYGACIHVPPPPANQTVHVVTGEDQAYRGELFDTVWVTGTIRVEQLSSELGVAGYRIEARKIEPYE